MLFLGIDQHARQLTVSLRNHEGDVIFARQVSTRPTKGQALFHRLTQRCAREDEMFVAVVEVCCFNDSLIRMLREARFWRMFLEG